MREPEHARRIVHAMTSAVKIPVTVKMRAGWNDADINAPTLAKMVEDAGAAAVTVHGRTAAQSYTGQSDWNLIAKVAQSVNIPVFGSGDCVEPGHILDRLAGGISGVLVGRGVLRNPWILAQAGDLAANRGSRSITHADRGQFLLDYIALLLNDESEESRGFRHRAPGGDAGRSEAPAQGRDRWVINKLRALCSWYTKGLENGAHLRVAVNSAESLRQLEDIIVAFFMSDRVEPALAGAGERS
jgi:tRNA-dihydrouridine synthase